MHRYGRGAQSAFQRPENALKRAEELQRVGQKTAAVLALHDVLTSRRHRAWIKGLEDIVYRFIDLCVEERMGRYAKEALMQYRNTCQNVNINSLEEVIKYFLKKATERAEEAQVKADAVIQEIDDLDEEQSPEDLMLSYVSDKSNKDRADRELVAPWFKFLWETYRNILEILRNNVKFTQMYGMVTKQAFHFCLQYKRNTEFRRLCEILRNQLLTLKKNRDNRDNRDRPDLSNPETLNQCLETRFEQLNVACQLEMWQEAFRSIEDIHGLWAIYKKMPKPNLRAQYFSCLTQIFSKSGSHCYHAYSWYQLYTLSSKVSKNLTQSDKAQMASAVLLATLAIDPYDRKGPESMGEHPRADRASRIIDILGFTPDPYRTPEEMLSRANLLTELHRHSILKEVPAEIATIFKCLEQDRDPLHLCQIVAPHLAALEGKVVNLSSNAPVASVDHGQHLSQLKSVAVLKMMRQLSGVYSVMRIDKLSSLVPFMSFPEVEAVLADAIKFGYVQVQIDHRMGTLHFGGANLRNEGMAGHLSNIAGRLAGSMHLICPEEIMARQDERAAVTAARARETDSEVNKTMLARKVLIERRKEEHERAREEAEKEEEQKKRAEQAAREAEESARRAEEARKREEERLTREYAEEEAEEVRKMMREKGIMVKEGETLDKRALMQREFERKAKEANEFEAKMNKIARNMDYLERARREEELPYLEEAMKIRAAEQKEYFEAEQVNALKLHKEKWLQDVDAKHRSTHLSEDKEVFKQQVSERRAAEFARLREAQERKRKEELRRRQQERDNLRKKNFIERCRAELDEKVAELQAKAEEEAKEAAKHEAAAKLEALKRRKEEEAKAEEERIAKAKAKADELARKAEASSAGTSGAAASTSAADSGTSSTGKYVPKYKVGGASSSSAGAYKPPQRSGGAAGGSSAFGGSGGGSGGAFSDRYKAGGDRTRDSGGPRGSNMPAAFGGSRRDEEGAPSRTFGGPPKREGGGFPGSTRPPAEQSEGAPSAPAPAPAAAPAPASAAPKGKGSYVPPHLRGK